MKTINVSDVEAALREAKISFRKNGNNLVIPDPNPKLGGHLTLRRRVGGPTTEIINADGHTEFVRDPEQTVSYLEPIESAKKVSGAFAARVRAVCEKLAGV